MVADLAPAVRDTTIAVVFPVYLHTEADGGTREREAGGGVEGERG